MTYRIVGIIAAIGVGVGVDVVVVFVVAAAVVLVVLVLVLVLVIVLVLVLVVIVVLTLHHQSPQSIPWSQDRLQSLSGGRIIPTKKMNQTKKVHERFHGNYQ